MLPQGQLLLPQTSIPKGESSRIFLISSKNHFIHIFLTSIQSGRSGNRKVSDVSGSHISHERTRRSQTPMSVHSSDKETLPPPLVTQQSCLSMDQVTANDKTQPVSEVSYKLQSFLKKYTVSTLLGHHQQQNFFSSFVFSSYFQAVGIIKVVDPVVSYLARACGQH